MGRKSLKAVRQKEIIRAFYRVAKKEGVENASIAKVAEVLDVNPSLVIHYFNTKRDLVHGLIEFILERYKKIYGANPDKIDTREQLEEIIRNLFSKKWGKLVDDSVLYASFALIFRDRTLRIHFKNMHDHLRRLLAQALDNARKNGVISIDNVDQTADLIFILVEGAYYYLSMVSNEAEYNLKIARYQQMVLSLLQFVPVRAVRRSR